MECVNISFYYENKSPPPKKKNWQVFTKILRAFALSEDQTEKSMQETLKIKKKHKFYSCFKCDDTKGHS